MIRVMLINDYKLVSNLIAASLDEDPDIEVVGTCTPDENLIENIRKNNVDIVLISGQLSTVKAIDLVSEFDNLELPVEMLILGLEERKSNVLPYIEAGASGYIVKDASVEDLIKSIHAAYSGRAQVSPKIARALIERVYRLAGEFDNLDSNIIEDAELTPREMEVLELLGENLTNQQIAERLFVEVGTVKNHVHSILQKLDVNSRHEAARYLAILKH